MSDFMTLRPFSITDAETILSWCRDKHAFRFWSANRYNDYPAQPEEMIDHIRETTDIKSLISGHFVDNPAFGRVMEKCGFVPTGETCIDANQYQGADRPIRVLRLELR